MEKTVHYCCVSRSNRTLYVYSSADQEIEQLATLCLDNVPPYHSWYFETVRKRTFGFLMEDGYVYFAIADEGLRYSTVLHFLEHVRDEFNKAKKGSRLNNSSVLLQEQLVPVINRLINSLEHFSSRGNEESNGGQIELANCTKAPLLGKSSKQDKSKCKDEHHVIGMRDVESSEQRKSTDHRGGGVVKSSSSESSAQDQKDLGSARIRSSSCIRKKWWRQVRIVLAIDAAVCVVLFVIWLSICGGLGCIR
ncbi:Phytolongin Phyl1.1 [Linum grandiflorum]